MMEAQVQLSRTSRWINSLNKGRLFVSAILSVFQAKNEILVGMVLGSSTFLTSNKKQTPVHVTFTGVFFLALAKKCIKSSRRQAGSRLGYQLEQACFKTGLRFFS
jgi:hypothetical protein